MNSIEKDAVKKFLKCFGALWIISMKDVVSFGEDRMNVTGPFCLSCNNYLDRQDEDGVNWICESDDCQKKHTIDIGDFLARNKVLKLYYTRIRQNYDVEALDVPPGKVSDKDNEDKDHWISANMGQYRGKKTGVIYFGDKKRRTEKAHLFIDLEDEQIRFDNKGDSHPLDIVAKVTVEFPKSTHTMKGKSEKK